MINSDAPLSYSQLGQDLEVIKFYKYKSYGFFVEIGALFGKFTLYPLCPTALLFFILTYIDDEIGSI